MHNCYNSHEVLIYKHGQIKLQVNEAVAASGPNYVGAPIALIQTSLYTFNLAVSWKVFVAYDNFDLTNDNIFLL